MIATEKHYAFRGRLMSLLVLRYSGISSRPHLPQESPCFSSASLSLLTTDCGGNSNIKTSYNFTSPGESRAVTPRKCKPIFFVRCNAVEVPLSCGNSTCLKTPQYFKEGRLKPFFANNVDIPFARARRLRPCPRKATVRSGKQMHLLRSL